MNKYIAIILLVCSTSIFGQSMSNFDIVQLFQDKKLDVYNREAEISKLNRSSFLKISESFGEGLVWLPLDNFENGVISIEVRGIDMFQRSFIGIAFHGKDASTYEAIYCRPFNFLATDSVRRAHAIQYISHPTYTWKKLREAHNGIFEKEIKNPPDPKGWFTLTVDINRDIVKAYIDNSQEESLVIKKLSNNHNGKLGIFLGSNSGGDFRNIIVIHRR